MYFNHLDNLEERVAGLLRDSKEQEFTNYLLQLQKRVENQKRQVALLTEELNRNEQVYRSRVKMQSAPGVEQQPVLQSVPQPAPVTQQQVQSQTKKSNAEFAVGATVLSIVGSVFILTALVMLGMYFMTGLLKGMLLYGGCLAVMLLAELLVYRRFPKLGMTLSAIGMGGLYISTLVNYISLKNFNHWVTLGVTILITIAVIILSRKREAAAYRILGMAAMYISMYMVLDHTMISDKLSQPELFAVALFSLVITVMCLCVPVKKGHTAIQITHMALNTFFAIFMMGYWNYATPKVFDSVSELWGGPAALAVSILVMQLLFIAQVRWQAKENPDCDVFANAGICVTYCMSCLIYMVLTIVVSDYAGMLQLGSGDLIYLPYRMVNCVIVVALSVIPLIALRKRQEKWFSWYLLNMLIVGVEGWSDESWEFIIVFTILLIIGKGLSFINDSLLRVSDAVVTTLGCIFILTDWNEPWSLILLAGLIVGMLCINYWHVYFEIVLTYTIAFYASWHMLDVLKLPVFVGIMFIGMLLYNNVERWRGKGIEAFNALALSGQAVCYLLLISPAYRNEYLTYLCMLIFGITTIVVCFDEQYQLDFKGKPLVLSIFLTYMGLVVRTGYPIVNSILLMIIALGCVGAGFIIKKKTERIYGLVLSLAVCGKLVLYDFVGANALQKTILFFAVGMLALIIAGIYMVLERNREKCNLEK